MATHNRRNVLLNLSKGELWLVAVTPVILLFVVFVMEACKRLTNESNPIDGMFKIVELMYGEKKCHDISEEFVECADPTGCGGSLAWSYQSCAEMLMPAGTNNVTDMFPVLPFTVQERKEYCQQRWGLTPRDHWFSISMWGNQLQTTSNIVFSNGDLDPWREGGVLTNVSDSVVALEIKGGAHHLDLRSSNKEDPPSVKAVRKTEIQHISKWIKEARMRISK